VIALNRKTLDLTNFGALRQRFAQDSPSLLIHCAAISRSPQCEQDPDLARLMNVDVTGFLAELFTDKRMLFFSTDLVFDGRKGDYCEEDSPEPFGVYARTKLDAEARVLAHPNHMVIRTSLNGGMSPTGDRGFNEGLRNKWKAGGATRLFHDEFRSPIAAPVTARATWELAKFGTPGIYHLAGSERLSRLRIGELVAARHPELNPQIESCSLKDYDGPPRSADCSMNCAKAQERLTFKLPGLTGWLEANPKEPF